MSNSGSRSEGEDKPDGAAADVALLLAIADRRDRGAFVTLFDRFAPRLKSWFQRSGSSPEQAEDLAQETMLSVWRKVDSFDPNRAGVATWIFTIARNQRIDAARRVPRRMLDAYDPSLVPQAPDAPDTVIDTMRRESLLRDALIVLPPEQADVIRLAFFEDRPHADIERTLGIPLGTVKSRLRLAMKRLRAHLVETSPGGSHFEQSPSGDFHPGKFGPPQLGRTPDGDQP